MKLYSSRNRRTPGRRPGSQEKGVALITVLAIVLLMTVLITSFFTMSRNELTTAIKDSENLKARALADAAVNMAIAQVREATTQVNTDGGFLAWSSQPGGIRVYRNEGTLRSIIKLYSARTMQAESMAQMASQDIRNDWDALPDHWVDMNAPSITPSAAEPNNLDQALVVFPIVDPRAMRSNKKDSVEGFSYERRAVNGIVPPSGGKPNAQRLPMPVRWIYLLADGSSGVLNNGGEFDAAEGGGVPTKENPIVGRLGFWTDDETCKINLNTASEGVHWDTPRASTEEERWNGASQPLNGEYQRYPGHPAMVSISTVLFPHKRFRASNSQSPLPPKGGGVDMDPMDEDEVQSIWRMSPYIFGEKDNTKTLSSSFGGRQRPAGLAEPLPRNPSQVRSLKGEPNPKHLYNSYDDYVIAATADAKLKGRPADIEVRERVPVTGSADIDLPVDRIQQGRFFLTTRSAAPEITIGGTPRISLWPLAGSEGGWRGVDQELLSERPIITASSPYSVYDVLIGFNTHLRIGRQIRPYYFQRQDVGSRHAEFYDRFGGRNNTLWRYMSNVMVEPIPGFTVPTDTTLGTFRNFGAKYGGGLLDDTNAIAALMIDYIRNQNLTDGNINSAQWYVQSGAWGQVTPICMCGGSSVHAATWSFSTRPLPKGVGRFLTVSEVALAVGLRNKIAAGTTLPNGAFFGDNQQQAAALGTGFDHYEVEVAVLIEGFSTAQGWGEYRPRAAFALAGYDGGTKQMERRPNTNANGTAQEFSIGDMTLSGKRLAFPSNQANRSTAVADQPTAPGNWVGWGGTLGTRFTSRLIAFKPLLFSLTPGEQPPLFSFSGTPNNPSQTHIRLIVSDTSSIPDVNAGFDTGNLIQFFPLAFPEISGVSFALPFNDPNPIPFTAPAATGGPAAGKTTRIQRSRLRTGELYGENGLLHTPYDIVQSLVPNHGDFRLLAAKRAVMQGQGRDGENNNAREYPTFVAHPNYGVIKMAHSLTEPQPALNARIRQTTPYTSPPALSQDDGYFDASAPRTSGSRAEDMDFQPAYLPDFPIKPYADRAPVRLVHPLNTSNLGRGAISGGRSTVKSMAEVFNSTRYDILSGTNRFARGPGRPDKTGDFDTGVGPSMDGPYTGRGDDGDVNAARNGNGWPYFEGLDGAARGTAAPFVNAAMFSPNRVVASAGVFGSLPTGIQTNVPWQTLLFRPDLELIRPGGRVDLQEQHYGSRFPRDHLMMDLFWMPVVQPYAISEPFETKGKINMNYQIVPFTYMKRATALHALLKAEKILAIPDVRTDDYKIAETQGGEDGEYLMADRTGPAHFRHFIDAEQTLTQWEDRFNDTYPRGTPSRWRPGAFISPTEICDQWLVPQGYTMDDMYAFWTAHRQTGDNVKERPYVNLYPRLTTRSNTYRVHVVAQALRKNRRSDPKTFDQALGDQVMAEYRGSYLIERSIDPSDPDIPDYATILRDNPGADYTPLDKYYYYRISQVKQFVR